MGHEPVTDVTAFEGGDLMATLHAAWAPLAAAVATRRGAFHTPTVAMISASGAPRLRTVVLRGCEPCAWSLRFHTDRRSSKFAELAANPAIALHAYSQSAKLQVRIDGIARLHCDDEVADLAWADSRPSSRECYAQGAAPGILLEAPEPDRNPAAGPLAPLTAARDNFCAVVVEVAALEWLYLRAAGHRRAKFCRDGITGHMSGAWLAP